MSYEPTIIVRKKDLEKHRNKIENAEWETIPKKKFVGKTAEERILNLTEAYTVLLRALDYEPITFPEIELVIICVEFTSKNSNVRDLLNELKIEYRLWD